jgi:hypothetical protein
LGNKLSENVVKGVSKVDQNKDTPSKEIKPETDENDNGYRAGDTIELDL